jgi:hypothetical protein
LLNLAANDTDADDGLDLASIAIVAGPANGTLLNNNDGTVTYTHNGSETTTDSFTYTIEDPSNAVSNTATVSITVTPQNDAPIATNDNGTVNEGGNVLLNLAVNDTDADDGLDLTSIAIVTGPANGTLLNNNDGTVTYTHNGGETTIDSFTYTIEDPSNAVSNTATVSITVTPQNDAPVAANDIGSVNQGGNVILNLATNDTDADDGLDLASIAIVAGPANGSLINNNNGTLTYTHNGSETTTDSFTYTIEDLGNQVSNTATVSITVIPAPAGDFTAWLAENSLPADPSLDTDRDSASNIVEYIIGGNPVNRNDASLLPTGAVVTADPDQNTIPSSYLLFTHRRTNRAANDGTIGIAVEWNTNFSSPWNKASSTPGVVILEEAHPVDEGVKLIKVYIPKSLEQNGRLFARLTGSFTGPANIAPVAVNDSGSVIEGGNVLLNLAANDTDADNGLDLTSIAIVSGPANGSLLDNNDGTVTYTHNGSATISDSFTYTIEDQSGAVSNTATVNITVTPAPPGNFTAWLAENSLPAGPEIDTDRDSASNIIEYIIGGNPVNRNDTDVMPSAELVTADPDQNTISSTYLLFTYRRTTRAAADTTIGIAAEWSTNLSGGWNNASSTPGVVILEQAHPVDEEVKLIKVYLPRSLEQNGRLFARLSGIFPN